MPAILAKKLGMTQVFLDDGRVERVTVLEAGPCPVTAIRTPDRDGYEAVQLGFGEVKEKRLTKAERGHLAKADAPPLRHLCEFRDEAGELQVGDTVTVEAFEVGQKVKIAGISRTPIGSRCPRRRAGGRAAGASRPSSAWAGGCRSGACAS